MNAAINTDREIWRQELNDDLDPGNFYAPVVFITEDDCIGISAAGQVIIMSPKKWIEVGGKEIRNKGRKVQHNE